MKEIILGVTGGIAAYKACDLTSMLRKKGYNVHVIMTKNAMEFVSPLVFETLTNNNCITDQFKRVNHVEVEHVSLAKKADLFVVAPATANVIAKLANGIADDALTTQFLACNCPKLICPAMNTNMYLNPITVDNFKKLRSYGINIMEAETGLLACRDTGIGKLPDVSDILDYIEYLVEEKKDYAGKKVLVTSGATREAIDPVRYISNHSTGKMGVAIATEFLNHGADVTLVHAAISVKVPKLIKQIETIKAKEMFDTVSKIYQDYDYIVMTAAISDYTPATISTEKIKKQDGNLTLNLTRTTDILKYLGENKLDNQKIIGFSMETENLIENSKAKLAKKNCDLIVANNLKEAGAGFGVDTNKVTFITKDDVKNLDLMSKKDVAKELVEYIKNL